MKLPVVLALALFSPLSFAAAPAFAPEDVPSLDGIRLKYVASAARAEADIRGFIADGSTCGFIGGIMVGKMGDAEQSQAKSRQEIDQLLAAVIAGDAGKRAAAKARIEAELVSLKDSYQQVESNIGIIRNALSTNAKSCKAANQAFFDIQVQNKVMTAQLLAARQFLNGKQAELMIDVEDSLEEAYISPFKGEETEPEPIQTSALLD